MKRIQAKNRNKIGTYEIDKISLSQFDGNRFVLDNGVDTLAYFDYFIIKNVIRMKMKMEIISSIDIEGIMTVCYQYYYFFMKKILSI